MRRARKQGRIGKILNEIRGLKFFAGIKTIGRRIYVGRVLDRSGNPQTERDGIVSVFADFYEDLYRRWNVEVISSFQAVGRDCRRPG